MKAFIVEDDITLASELKRLLEQNNYEVEVANDFTNLRSVCLSSDPDIVLLDLNLPGADGINVCRDIRSTSQVPIIVLTSRVDEVDEVMSMRMGADDFIAKPYRPHILLARMDALLRRINAHEATRQIKHGGAVLDIDKMRVAYEDQVVHLTQNEMRILQILMKNPGVCCERQAIMYELWSSDDFIDDNTLTVNVNRLRKKLASIGLEDFLITYRGRGYAVVE